MPLRHVASFRATPYSVHMIHTYPSQMIPRTADMESSLALAWSHAFLPARGGTLLVRVRRDGCDDTETCLCAATPAAVVDLLDLGCEILGIEHVQGGSTVVAAGRVQEVKAVDWVISPDRGVETSLALQTASGAWILGDTRADLSRVAARRRFLTWADSRFEVKNRPGRHIYFDM